MSSSSVDEVVSNENLGDVTLEQLMNSEDAIRIELLTCDDEQTVFEIPPSQIDNIFGPIAGTSDDSSLADVIYLGYRLRAIILNSVLDVLEGHAMFDDLTIRTSKSRTCAHHFLFISSPLKNRNALREIVVRAASPEINKDEVFAVKTSILIQRQLKPRTPAHYVEHPEIEVITEYDSEQLREEHGVKVCTVLTDLCVPFVPKTVPKPVDRTYQCFYQYSKLLNKMTVENKFRIPISTQFQSWPILMNGEDLILISPYKTGKSMAFIPPAIVHATERRRNEVPHNIGPTVVVIAYCLPKGRRIFHEFQKLLYDDITVFDGTCLPRHCIEKANKSDILILTPNAWLSVKNGDIVLNQVGFVVFVEPTSMQLDANLNKAFKMLSLMPCNIQVVVVSDIWPISGTTVTAIRMSNPFMVEVGPYNTDALNKLPCYTFYCRNTKEKIDLLIKFALHIGKQDKLIVYCKNNHEEISNYLTALLIRHACLSRIIAIHMKEAILMNFNYGITPILIVDDLSARLLDVRRVTSVIHFNMPSSMMEYMQRLEKLEPTGMYVNYVSVEDSEIIIRNFLDFMRDGQKSCPYELALINRKYDITDKNIQLP